METEAQLVEIIYHLIIQQLLRNYCMLYITVYKYYEQDRKDLAPSLQTSGGEKGTNNKVK